MSKYLAVTTAFAGYARGDRITDPVKIAEILAGEQAAHVVAVQAPEPSAPPAAKEPE